MSSISALYCHTVNLETSVLTDDNLGNSTETWSTKTANIPCRITTLSTQYRTVNKKGEYIVTHIMRIGNMALDEKTDRFKQGSTVYEIKSIKQANDAQGTVDHLKLELLEVK